MPKAYSPDLRDRIMQAIKSGQTKKEVSKNFSISIRSIDRWQKLEKETGSYKAKPYVPQPYKIKDLDSLREDFSSDKTVYQKDIAKKYGVAQSTICLALNRAEITYKKNFSVSGKGQKKARKLST